MIKWFDYIRQETLFWRRRDWEAIGSRVDESLHFAMDWELILRFVAAGMKFQRLPRSIGAFRVTETHKTSSLWESVGQHEVAQLRKRELGRVPTDQEIARTIDGYEY